MDNLCHTLVGAALGEAGLKRRTRFGAATLMIGSNLPDVDVFVFASNTPPVAFRRGWTHGVIADALLPVLLTWSTDVGAYMFGRMFGRKKLIPSISPGKTVEGAVGGLGLAIVICLLYVRFVLMPYAQLGLTIQGAVLFAIVVSVAAQTGDLAESLLKREAGVKDSSRIIPGHGGILDRFDSLLFVMPIAFLLLGRLLLPIPQ